MPIQIRYFFPLFRTPRKPLEQTSLLFNGYRGSFVELQLLGSEVNYSPPSSAEVTNEWSPISTPLYAFMAWTLLVYPNLKKNTPFRLIEQKPARNNAIQLQKVTLGCSI
jgi:hypothetical protein